MYLLDTNVVSELRRVKPHGGVLAWLDEVDDANLNVSAVTIGEIQSGIEATRGRDAGKAAMLEEWLESVASAFNVLPVDARAFRAFARLMHGRPDRLKMDALIAATAQTRNLIVVTRDTTDFDALGIESLNPFLDRRT